MKVLCECGHEKIEHNDEHKCCAEVVVIHFGQEFVRTCGCMKWREDRPATLARITPDDLLNMPVTSMTM